MPFRQIYHLPFLRDRLLVAVIILEGCRTVEMHRLSIKDIIRRGKNVGLRVKGKRSLRIVPLTVSFVKLLELYLEARLLADHELTPDTPMFISVARNNYGHRLTRRSIQRIVDKYLKATISSTLLVEPYLPIACAIPQEH